MSRSKVERNCSRLKLGLSVGANQEEQNKERIAHDESSSNPENERKKDK